MCWTVADVMTRGVITVSPSTSFDACETLRRIHGVGTLPVVDGGRLVGLFSESEVLTKDIPSTTADTPLTAACGRCSSTASKGCQWSIREIDS